MATAVDDEVDQAAAPAIPPTPTKPAGQPEVDVEIGKDSGNDRDWTEVGKIVIPGQPLTENLTTEQPPTSSRAASQPTPQPAISGPRSPSHRQSSSNFPSTAKEKPSTDDSLQPSPAIAPESMLSQPATGQPDSATIAGSPASPKQSESPGVSPPASSAEAPGAKSDAPQSGTADRPATSGPENAAPPETPTEPEPSETPVSGSPETSATEQPADASPAFVGEEQLVHGEEAENLAERGQGEQPGKTGEEKGKDGEEKKEAGEGEEKKVAGDADEKKEGDKPSTEGEKKEPAKDDTGPLQGVAGAGEEKYDPFSAAKTPTGTSPTAAPGGEAVAGSAEKDTTGQGAKTGSADAGRQQSATEGEAEEPSTSSNSTAQELRAGKVDKQRIDQQAVQRIRQGAQKIQEMRDMAATALAEAQRVVEQVYKQAWQNAQEAVEIWALSFADFLLISGPLTVALYISRWMFGNMMGELFKKEVEIPFSGAITGGEPTKISIKIFPPYTLSDIQDHERHAKILVIGSATLIIYGFIIMLLYYITHPWEATVDALKTSWGLIIGIIP